MLLFLVADAGRAWARAGIEIEVKAVVASVFFSSDPANPDTYSHFYADLQMYNTGPGAPDPERLMWQFTTAQIASKDNKWTGRNITRFRHEAYDRLWAAGEQEMDPVKRAAQFIRMNDLVIQHVAVIPVLWRNGVVAVGARPARDGAERVGLEPLAPGLLAQGLRLRGPHCWTLEPPFERRLRRRNPGSRAGGIGGGAVERPLRVP